MKKNTVQKISALMVVFTLACVLILAGCENPAVNNGNNAGEEQQPTVTSVTVSPATATVAPGYTLQLSAAVTGTHNPAQTVTWTVEGGGNGTGITTGGLLSVAGGEIASSVTVRATSTVDTTKSGTASITVTSSPTFGITLDRTGTHAFASVQTGYDPVTPMMVTVTNTGNQATGTLNVTLSGANAGSFTRTPASIPGIAAGGTATFTVGPNAGLPAGTYTAIVMVSGGSSIMSQSFNVSFEVADGTTWSISLDRTGTHAFTSAQIEYDPVTPLTVTVTNTGNQATGQLHVDLSGANAGSFTRTPASIPDIAAGKTAVFNVGPNAGLAIGTYTATVTVSGGEDIHPQSFNVLFTVSPFHTPPPAQVIAAGYNYTMYIRDDGTLWAWGSAEDGRTGLRMELGSTGIPFPVGRAANWHSVSAASGEYYSHTVAIKTDGTLWAWGSNNSGQLGNNTTTNSTTPVQIGNATNWSSVSAGYRHTVAIKTDGTLWAWGYNWNGKTGLGTFSGNTLTPTQIGNATNWSSVSAGSEHTVAIKTDGTLWAWGYNWYGQLGNNTTVNSNTPIQIGDATNWASVSAGSEHTVAIKTDGTLWAWGSNYAGKTGRGFTDGNTLAPTQVGIASNWVLVSAGDLHTMAIREDNSLWSWGSDSSGQIANGFVSRSIPGQVQPGTTWASVDAGYRHTVAIRNDGTLCTWGSNGSGGLGDGTVESNNPVPTQISMAAVTIPVPIVATVTSVSAGEAHTLTIGSNGTLWAWGSNMISYNAGGQTGLGMLGRSPRAPLQVGNAINWSSISAGFTHTAAIRTDGTLWAWGDNTNGKTGLGTTFGVTVSPTQVGNGTNWMSVSAGSEHTVAIKTDGTLWAWGNRGQGRLGDGTDQSWTPQTTPVQIGNETNWASVSAGVSHTVAVKTDGTLWAWGSNWDGLTSHVPLSGNTLTPTQIGDALNWASVSASRYHTLAVRTNGTLWAWGSNTNGRTGLGITSGFTSTPTQIAVEEAYNWLSVSAGDTHSMAIRTGGTLWSWGSDSSGQIANDNVSRSFPGQVQPGTTWTSVSAGSFFTAGIKTDGTLWTWGSNGAGRLGVGTSVDNSNIPIHIVPSP